MAEREGLVDTGLTARYQVLRTPQGAQTALRFFEPSDGNLSSYFNYLRSI